MKTKSVAAYELRANPKKSLRVSCGGSPPSSDLSNICKICGKGFSKRRQLCGHLRHHTIGERRERPECKECGKRFKSIRALCGHMKSHRSDGGFGTVRAFTVNECCWVRKRARTPRFEVSERSHFDFDSPDLNHEKEDETALDEVAASLIMLSQGFEFSCNASLNAAVNENEAGGCEVELVDEGLKGDGFETRKLELAETGFGSCEKKSSEIELGICINVDESKNVGTGSSLEDGLGVCIGTTDHVKTEDDICGVSGSAMNYKCVSCNKSFSSHQALGGHRSAKNRTKRYSSALKTETCQKTNLAAEGTSKKPECAAYDVHNDEICTVGIPHFELLKRCKLKRKRSSKTEICRRTNPVAERNSKKSKCAVEYVEKDETCSVGVAHFELSQRSKHNNSLRLKVFRSVQRFGEQMGAHVAESSTVNQIQQTGNMQETAIADLSMISQSPLASRKMVVS